MAISTIGIIKDNIGLYNIHNYIKKNIDINSINGQNELKNYKYKEDRNGTITEEPVKFRDHFIDAVRYAVYSFAKKYFMFSGPKRSANSSHKERKQRSRLSSELAGY